ncbi:hypothetical protein ACROYT_G023062 [Oculina patagonica]
MALNQPLLDVLTAPRVEKVYMDHGTGARMSISVFQAELKSIPEGAYMIGQVAVPAHTSSIPTSSVILVWPMVPRDGYGNLFMPPTGYEQVWIDRGSGGKQNGSFWRVQAPYGYVALGDVACNGHSPPTSQFTAKYACIRGDLLSEGALDTAALWTDQGSGTPMNVSIWNVKGNGLGGFFKAHAGYNRPTCQAFVLPAKVSRMAKQPTEAEQRPPHYPPYPGYPNPYGY